MIIYTCILYCHLLSLTSFTNLQKLFPPLTSKLHSGTPLNYKNLKKANLQIELLSKVTNIFITDLRVQTLANKLFNCQFTIIFNANLQTFIRTLLVKLSPWNSNKRIVFFLKSIIDLSTCIISNKIQFGKIIK